MKFTVKFPDASIRGRLRKFRTDLDQRQPEVLEAIGVRVLSFAKLDYVTKSRGGTGTDGIRWKPLEASTIKQKNRRGKRNFKRKTTKGGKPRPTFNQSAIGIHVGLQLNSASPGYSDSGRTTPPKRTAGRNILFVSGSTVTIGYGRTYSEHFDRVRPLLPNRLPPPWREACEDILVRWAERLLKEALRG